MAINFYNIDRTSKFGGELIDLAQLLRRAKQSALTQQERMSHMNDGTTFTQIKTLYGIPNLNSDTDSQTGSAAKTLIDALVTALSAANVNAFIERVG